MLHADACFAYLVQDKAWLTLSQPSTWHEARTVAFIAQVMINLYERFDEAGITVKATRADVTRAVDRLKSLQDVNGEGVKADHGEPATST